MVDGVVITSTLDSTYGNMIEYSIAGNEHVSILYAHNSKNIVKIGDKLKAGDIIGYMGSSGRSTGSHLHLEIKYKSKQVNPANIFKFK